MKHVNDYGGELICTGSRCGVGYRITFLHGYDASHTDPETGEFVPLVVDLLVWKADIDGRQYGSYAVVDGPPVGRVLMDFRRLVEDSISGLVLKEVAGTVLPSL